jgi:prepilin-type N-terminal cleavage/methylation domain-containing protein
MPFSSTGFTLIELLVVISIIGLLSSVVLSSLNSARAKARDAKRLSDLNQIRTALILYAADHDGNYPTNYGSSNAWPAGLSADLAPYLSPLPVDPLPYAASNNYYAYSLVQVSWNWDVQFTNSLPSCNSKLALYDYPTEHKIKHVDCNGPDMTFLLP